MANETKSKVKIITSAFRANCLKIKLARLSEDFAQERAGLVVPDIERKRGEFRKAHDELRALEGKQPRVRIRPD